MILSSGGRNASGYHVLTAALVVVCLGAAAAFLLRTGGPEGRKSIKKTAPNAPVRVKVRRKKTRPAPTRPRRRKPVRNSYRKGRRR